MEGRGAGALGRRPVLLQRRVQPDAARRSAMRHRRRATQLAQQQRPRVWPVRGGGRMSEHTDRIATELLALRNDKGVINPTRAVEWAREHPQSRLHGVLEWDDAVAGAKYRNEQVRKMIPGGVAE